MIPLRGHSRLEYLLRRQPPPPSAAPYTLGTGYRLFIYLDDRDAFAFDDAFSFLSLPLSLPPLHYLPGKM